MQALPWTLTWIKAKRFKVCDRIEEVAEYIERRKYCIVAGIAVVWTRCIPLDPPKGEWPGQPLFEFELRQTRGGHTKCRDRSRFQCLTCVLGFDTMLEYRNYLVKFPTVDLHHYCIRSTMLLRLPRAPFEHTPPPLCQERLGPIQLILTTPDDQFRTVYRLVC